MNGLGYCQSTERLTTATLATQQVIDTPLPLASRGGSESTQSNRSREAGGGDEDDEETEDDEERLVMEGLSALAAAEPVRPAPPKPKRGRGRPRGVKNGQGAGSKATVPRAAATGDNMAKRGRGRPPGVKNGQVRVCGDAHWQATRSTAESPWPRVQADWTLDVRF